MSPGRIQQPCEAEEAEVGQPEQLKYVGHGGKLVEGLKAMCSTQSLVQGWAMHAWGTTPTLPVSSCYRVKQKRYERPTVISGSARPEYKDCVTAQGHLRCHKVWLQE